MPPTAAIVAIGSEITLGQMTDTNSAWLSAYLTEKGLNVVRHLAVGDDLPTLAGALADSYRDHEVTMVTGGLGPTEDDLTRLAVARGLGRTLEFHPALAQGIASFMTDRGYDCSPNNYRQAWLPGGCSLVENPWGTAPAFCLEGKGRLMLFTPGVPQEMKNIVRAFLGPKLVEMFPSRLGYHRTTTLRASGLGESRVDYLLADLTVSSANPAIGFLAGPYETRILVTSKARDAAEADLLEAPILAEIIKRLGQNYVGQGDQTMVTSSRDELKSRSLKFGLVDSFTSGSAAIPFLTALERENLAGALSITEKRLDEGIKFLFLALGADLVGVIQAARPSTDPLAVGQPSEGEELSVMARLLRKSPEGPVEISSTSRQVGRGEAIAKTRAGALVSLLLWSHLKKVPID
jgi:competence/damage-inducible protein CinA-like protein